MIRIKNIHDEPRASDGQRILVDRLWPRGVNKEKAKVDLWMKDIAPSNELRRWFAHEPAHWVEFKKRYFKELEGNKEALDTLLQKQSRNPTLLYAAHDKLHNNAVALKEYISKCNADKKSL